MVYVMRREDSFRKRARVGVKFKMADLLSLCVTV